MWKCENMEVWKWEVIARSLRRYVQHSIPLRSYFPCALCVKPIIYVQHSIPLRLFFFALFA
jgi:hypothetical protein